MSKRVFSGILLIFLLIFMFASAFDIQPAKATGTIRIRADGSIDPPTAPIVTFDYVTYVFTDNVYDSITVERSNIVLDGQGYTLQGTGPYGDNGIALWSVDNVAIINAIITNTHSGISLGFSSNSTVSNNNIANNVLGVVLAYSSNTTVVGNTFTNDGLMVAYSYENFVQGNLVNGKPLVYLEGVSDYSVGNAGQVILVKCKNIQVESLNLSGTDIAIQLLNTTDTKIIDNNVAANNGHGILLVYSSSNAIVGNNITANNYYGIYLYYSSNNMFCDNNIIDNTHQVYSEQSVNIWYDVYPSGGNYWSDYVDVDSHSGQYQNKTSGDGIWDHPYVIDANNQDDYPLVRPFWYWSSPILGDVNKDMKVDGKDVVFIVSHWSLSIGNPRYDPLYDLDVPKDGRIDGKDLAIVAKCFGTYYP